MPTKRIKTPGVRREDYVMVEHFVFNDATYISASLENEQSVRVSNETAHAIANWILENVPKPDPLPKESGVYMKATEDPDEGPIVFSLWDGEWDSNRPAVINAEESARYFAENGGLVRLTKEEN